MLLDIGGRRAGYNSDITRTVWISGEDGSGPDDAFRSIYELTAAGQAAAREAVRPGVSFEALDAAARDVISGRRPWRVSSSIAWAMASVSRSTRSRTW